MSLVYIVVVPIPISGPGGGIDVEISVVHVSLLSVRGLILYGSVVPSDAKKRPGHGCGRG